MSRLVLAACLFLAAAPVLAQQQPHDHDKGAPAAKDATAAKCPMMQGSGEPGVSAGQPSPKDGAPSMPKMKRGMMKQGMMKQGMKMQGMKMGACMPSPSAPAPPAAAAPASPDPHDHSDPKAPGHPK